MIQHENPSTESLLHLRTDITWVLTILHENHDPETVATDLMDRLGASYNQTGVEGDAEFLSGLYWSRINRKLEELERAEAFHAPDTVSWVYTNEFILAEELQRAGYTTDEAVKIISKMRAKEHIRQDILHRAVQVTAVMDGATT